MRRFVSLLSLSVLAMSGCGDSWQPRDLYMATSAACSEWVDASRFDLPEGVSVSATAPVTTGPGGAEFGMIYVVPRGGKVQFTTRAFDITQPKGPLVAKAKLVTFYQRGTDARAEMVEVIETVPGMLIPVATSSETQWRVRLAVPQGLPERFDFVTPGIIIDNRKYPVRTFTYRWFAERKAYGLCR